MAGAFRMECGPANFKRAACAAGMQRTHAAMQDGYTSSRNRARQGLRLAGAQAGSVTPRFSTLAILLPIFALVLAGFVCRRRGIVGAAAATELNRLVVWLALAALLFEIMSCIRPRCRWQRCRP